MINTVQDLIDALNRIEDKSLPVCVGYRIAIDYVCIEHSIDMVLIWPDFDRVI